MRATINSYCLVFVIHNLHIVVATMTQCDRKYLASKDIICQISIFVYSMLQIMSASTGQLWYRIYIIFSLLKSVVLDAYDAGYGFKFLSRVRWYAILENKTPAETFPKFPPVLRVIDRSDRKPPITATSVACSRLSEVGDERKQGQEKK